VKIQVTLSFYNRQIFLSELFNNYSTLFVKKETSRVKTPAILIINQCYKFSTENKNDFTTNDCRAYFILSPILFYTNMDIKEMVVIPTTNLR
ncbi:hypothetical protein, partial [Coprobacter fastidiosus]|uniref:hypothetical protein n=1 Tax=Coprobacter fastidiosus TaxID=1099853 RepID=UPI001D9CA9DD